MVDGVMAVVRKMTPEDLLDYAAEMLKSPRFRETVQIEIKKHLSAKNIAGYGDIFIFDEDSRLIFHNGDLPGEYIGMTAAKMFGERVKLGGRGFQQTLGGIEVGSEGCSRYDFGGGEGVQLVCWKPVRMTGSRLYTGLLYAPEKDVLSSMGFYYRAWLTVIGTLLVNFVVLLLGIGYSNLVERFARTDERSFHKETIKNLEERYRLLIESSSDGIAMLDEDGIVVDANAAALAMGGFVRGDVVGKHFTHFFKEADRELPMVYFRKLSELNGAINYETLVQTKGGVVVPISISASVFEHDGRRLIQAGIRDITAMKAREEERVSKAILQSEVERLREMNTLKGNFLSMVSHELRTPLAVILGNISLALRHDSGISDDARKRLGIVERRSRELKDLIDDLLSLAAIEAGKTELHLETVTALEIINDAADACKDYSRDGKLTVVTKIEPENFDVHCDRNKLSQIINNLIKNSVKFMKDGTITIVARATADETVFSVTDTGPGIPESELGRVFERFHQVDNSMTRQWGGAGIGLTIAREMTELHGGWIRLRNVKPSGLCAEFSIPNEAARPDAGPKRPTVLIVDDDQEFCSLISHFLRENHFNVKTANDSESGLLLAETEKIDVALIDSRITPGDGFKLCRAISDNPKTRRIPVVILSTVFESEQSEKAIAAGAIDCIVRPFDFNELLGKMKTYTAQA